MCGDGNQVGVGLLLILCESGQTARSKLRHAAERWQATALQIAPFAADGSIDLYAIHRKGWPRIDGVMARRLEKKAG
jgi:hypothetical protein